MIQKELRIKKREGDLSNFISWEAAGVILAIIGAAVGWVVARKRRKSVSKYLTEIDDVFNQYKMKSKRCEAELYRLRDMISEELKKGNIDENAYTILDKRLDEYLREVRESELNEKFGGMPEKLKGVN